MVEKAGPQFRLRKTDDTRKYLLDEIKHNDLMTEKDETTCKYLNYVKNVLISVSAVTGCDLISAFPSLVCVPVDITSSLVGLNICALSAEIENYKTIIKKKKKHDKILVLWKDQLNTTNVLILKTLIDSYSHGEFVSVINVLREYYELKKETKKSRNFVECTI